MNANMAMTSAVLAPGAHFGALRTLRRMRNLIVAESSYAAGTELPRHQHEMASLTFDVWGGYVEEYRDRQIQCVPGTILFRPSGEAHRNQIGSRGAHCLMLELPQQWSRHMWQDPSPLEAPAHMQDHFGFLQKIRREMNLADDLTQVSVEALAIEVICEMQRSTATGKQLPNWLSRVRRRAEIGFRNPPSLHDLAREAGVHPAHMARTFRVHYGCTIGECMRRARIAYCCCELLDRTRTLCDIALSAGFASQSHFTSNFKQMTGTTPAAYRRVQVQLH